MKKPVHTISDHAVLRYLERVKGMDIAGLREDIGRRVDRGVSLGASAVVIDGFVFQIVNKVVVTVFRKN